MMIREDIPLYKLDLTAESEFNKVNKEYMYRRTVKNNNIVIPSKAPFYQRTVRLYDMAGKPLVEGEDYEFYGIMSKLTAFTSKPVGLFIRILKDEITEWYADYQVVGNFSKISNEILNMLKSIHEDDRYVLYENIQNKPLWFIPEIHQHDLAYDIYAFTDLARELNRIAQLQAAMTSAADFMVETLNSNLEVYIAGYKKVVMDLLQSHEANMHDAHGTNAAAIGLGNVDNIPCATLDETLEGLRDDLTITPYNAFLTVQAAAGRNERLYPAGTLPLLRYGSDTFIPPTIDGSFEGLGGMSKRSGAIIETDGTLLILQHRNNGKIRGLYFTRCADWRSQQAHYEFTAYQYQHPTATAAGATLDTIINGSNRYIMVVGDSINNKWWWCETHGTFDPAKHVLVPLTGKWVNEDMTMPKTEHYRLPWTKAVVLADKNYREHFAIMQAYSFDQYRARDPSYLPEVNVEYSVGTLTNYAYSFNVISLRSGNIERAKMTYKNAVGGDRVSDYWLPWEVEIERDPVIPNRWLTTAYYARFVNPSNYTTSYRGTHAYWLKTDTLDEFALRAETFVYSRSNLTGKATQQDICWRGKLKISKAADGVSITVTASPEYDNLYTIDLDKMWPGSEQYDEYYKNIVSMKNPNNTDTVGSAQIAPGVLFFSDGTQNVTFPSRYVIMNAIFAETWQKLITPPVDHPGASFLYTDYGKVVQETNPIGLGTLFENQTMGIGDVDNIAMGGVFARQNVDGANYTWIFRPLGNLDGNYAQVPPPLVGQYQGVVYNNYAFKPEAYKVSLQPQVLISSPLTVPGFNNKNVFKYVMGATSETTLLGTPSPGGVNTPNGDGKFMFETNIKLVNGVVTFNPVIVYNVNTAVERDLAALMAAPGLSVGEVKRTWSLGRILGADGNMYTIAQAWGIRGKEVLSVAMVVTVNPVGSPDTSKGYSEYADCRIIQRSPPVTIQRDYNIVNDAVSYANYATNSAQNSICLSVPYRSKNAGVLDKSGGFYAFSSGGWFEMINGTYRPYLALEINANCTVIERINHLPTQTWGTDEGIHPVPYYGVGNSTTGLNIFEGAAIGAKSYKESGNIYDNVIAGTLTESRVIGMSNILTPQYTVYFQEMTNVTLAGKMYNIPATYINLLDQDPTPANKKYYIYLYYTSGLARYVATETVRPETSSQSLIATVICGPTQIDRIIPYNRFSIDGASFSTVRQGSSILASSGSVYDVGDTTEILRDGDFIP